MEDVEHPIHPVDIMGDGEDQNTMWLLNMCIGTTWNEWRDWSLVVQVPPQQVPAQTFEGAVIV